MLFTGRSASFKGANYCGGMAIVDEMIRTRRGNVPRFREYGYSPDWNPLGRDLLADSARPAASAAKAALLEGWGSSKLRLATEKVMEQTRDPALTRTAFSIYVDADSMEASEWLVSRPAGPLRVAS